MAIVDSVPTVQAEDPIALIEEARRHKRHRRLVTAGVVALIVAMSLGVYVGVSLSGGGPSKGAPTAAAPSLVGLLANNGAYMECPGSAHVGPGDSPDLLPQDISRTDDLSFVESVAEEMTDGAYLGLTHPLAGLPLGRDVSAVRVVPGGGWVSSRGASGQIRVIPEKNYGIYVYLKAAARCPTGGWVRLVNNGVQVTFLRPKG
jgi:hypothetical protein